MATQKGWKVNVNRCFGCRACELACKTEYHLAAGEGRRRRVTEITALDTVPALNEGPLPGQPEQVRTYFLSMACNQCENPPCVEACPKNALKKTNTLAEFTDYLTVCGVDAACIASVTAGDYDRIKGVVLACRDLCIGCRRCEACCPYGAPQYNRTCRKIHKCELCWQRVINTALPDARRVPACVAQCGGSVAQRPGVSGSPAVDDVCHGPALELMDVDPDLDSEIYAGEPSGAYYRPGYTPDTLNHGSKDLATWMLSKPALKVRNREYILRDGGVRK